MTFLTDGDRKVTSDIDKACLLNRTFAAKFADPHVAVYPSIVDYSIDGLASFTVCGDLVKTIEQSQGVRPGQYKCSCCPGMCK